MRNTKSQEFALASEFAIEPIFAPLDRNDESSVHLQALTSSLESTSVQAALNNDDLLKLHNLCSALGRHYSPRLAASIDTEAAKLLEWLGDNAYRLGDRSLEIKRQIENILLSLEIPLKASPMSYENNKNVPRKRLRGSTPSQSSGYVPDSRVGKVSFTVHMPPELRAAVRDAAKSSGVTTQDYVIAILSHATAQQKPGAAPIDVPTDEAVASHKDAKRAALRSALRLAASLSLP